LRAPRRRSLAFAAMGTSLAAAAAFVVYLRQPPSPLPLGDSRLLELRVAYAPADRWRPYGAVRAVGPSHGESLPLDRMAALERAGDRHALGALYLLGGDARRAEEQLRLAPRSPDVEV